MEPVPETKKLEEFQSSPVPALKVAEPANDAPIYPPEFQHLRKTAAIRLSTDPVPCSPSSPSWTLPPLPYRPRASSPLSSNHVRSRSANLAPPMSRTQSMPTPSCTGSLLYNNMRPQSPSSPSRIRIPRKFVEESFPSSPTRMSVLDPERRLCERSSSPNLAATTSLGPVPRLRRPSSPLCQVSNANSTTSVSVPATPSSVSASPLYRPYDTFPTSYPSSYYAASSVPSTPTSIRSRSPSISSLETIPDSPDAEEAALEAERIAQLKAAAEASEGGTAKPRPGLDAPLRGRTLGGFSSRDKRKRWSVCGAERRQDFDLETIWED
ncbi:uncharacterized protein CTHT_0056770 [Thermochaetoides thermophila DSM 1495]|uniref:Basic proline-rich protein n=1 Tax=Chaetomium thermophilum (strain DSM 1495 / CBS 144.50 / IMI 039719) TaxID=759272 RepID=G0SCC9_CHATD|nr:hypothetical protein CTHT_0056770 [Thermochaetoides thermophila DSM 1495]EGS19055.1 hypothetical protein CTHT_0056770 [Thermochaetoides thermophila DSM 1495]